MWRKFTSQYLFFIALIISACSSVTPPQVQPGISDVVYIVGQGWHTDIGIPVNELDNNLAFYSKVFPGARVIMFGYGKKTFMTAPPETISEYFLGPVPGPAAIHVIGLRITPVEAYAPEDTITLALPHGGDKTLSEFIWKDLAKDSTGKPRVVATSTNPDGLFYAAVSEYNLLHTCNTWAADALQNAGLPLSADGVIFSHQLMGQAENAAENPNRQE